MWIIESVDISAKGQFRGSTGLEAGPPDQLVLDFLEHRFHHRVEAPIFVKQRRWRRAAHKVAIALAAHRRDDAVRLQQSLAVVRAILAAAIRVLNQTGRWAAKGDSAPQRIEGQVLLQPVARCPSDDAAGVEIEHNGQIEPALGCPAAGYLTEPTLRPRDRLLGAFGRPASNERRRFLHRCLRDVDCGDPARTGGAAFQAGEDGGLRVAWKQKARRDGRAPGSERSWMMVRTGSSGRS